MMQRLFWKLLPKAQRTFLLGRLSVVDRHAVNKAMSGSIRLPQAFARHNCLFIHVPKCAGSSICKALFDNCRLGHLPLYWYEQQFPQQYASAYKFAFVRDPLERAYSAYAFLLGDNIPERDAPARRLASRYRDFDHFVRGWLHEETVTRQLHFAPQWQFLCDSFGQLAMDFIGRQETLDADFRHVCEHFGVKVELPHENRSRRAVAPAASQVSAETARLVRRVYARDYELLGYD